ncbi:ATP-binding cassette domain-containing protein [Streptomyces sp. JJ36]|uniref:ATP-binding cassette domain-containing protein n=1 Tax=Streptomyces sp. JJ36 TaxID=2736645 RepID=UPI001F2F2918|nr:ABC transporter ATP-binding protein [Streptomyces sp. JJ36]MCF6526279.1 ABC transporter ATP-binding protein [Streptomyces sp. JJ36]
MSAHTGPGGRPEDHADRPAPPERTGPPGCSGDGGHPPGPAAPGAGPGPAALEASGLTAGYGRRKDPVVRDLSFRLPAGRVCALVGPNGSGKSTLLGLAAGLLRPRSGAVRVLGASPAAARERFAYVAQHKPLHPQLTVRATLRLGAELNPGRWDQEAAERLAYGTGLRSGTPVRSLSGGQRTRLALALALGKRADVLLLDEPMADLDPLARHELSGALLAEAAENGTTVVMSSHVVAELEDACDTLLLLGGGRVLLGGGHEELRTAHTLLTGTGPGLTPHTVVEERPAGRGRTALVRPRGPVDTTLWEAERPTLEEVVLAHLRNPAAPPLLTGAVRPDPPQEVAA